MNNQSNTKFGIEEHEEEKYLIQCGKFKLQFQTLTRKRIFLVLIGLILWLIILYPLGYWFEHEGIKFISEYRDDNLATDRIDIKMYIIDVNLQGSKFNVSVQIIPYGNLRTEGTFSKNMSVDFRQKYVELVQGVHLPPVSFFIPLKVGNVREYPLDYYEGIITVNTVEEVNIEVKAISSDLDIGLERVNKGEIMMKVRRSKVTLFFCCVVFILLWLLALTMTNLAWGVACKKRDTPPPILGVGIAMIFALPGLRNSQPGIPSIGCFIDIIGYMWCLFIIGISAIIVIFSWVLRWNTQ